MKYKEIIEDNESMKNTPVNDFARYVRMSPAYISKIKNGKVILSKRQYERIITLLTEYVK